MDSFRFDYFITKLAKDNILLHGLNLNKEFTEVHQQQLYLFNSIFCLACTNGDLGEGLRKHESRISVKRRIVFSHHKASESIYCLFTFNVL